MGICSFQGCNSSCRSKSPSEVRPALTMFQLTTSVREHELLQWQAGQGVPNVRFAQQSDTRLDAAVLKS